MWYAFESNEYFLKKKWNMKKEKRNDQHLKGNNFEIINNKKNY